MSVAYYYKLFALKRECTLLSLPIRVGSLGCSNTQEMAISPRNLIKLSQSSSKSDERPRRASLRSGETSPFALLLAPLWSHHLAGKYFGHKWHSSSYFMNMVSIPFTGLPPVPPLCEEASKGY